MKDGARMDIPADLFNELQRVAKAHGVTFTAVMQQFIRIGLLVAYANARDDTRVLIEYIDGTTELRLFDRPEASDELR